MAKQPTSAAMSGLRWQEDLLEFELANGGQQIACSISREALEDAGGGLRAKRWALEDVFNRLHAQITRIVLRKHGTAKPSSRAAIHVSTDDLNREPAIARA